MHEQPEATGPGHSQLFVVSMGTFPPLVQNGSFNVWGNTFGTNRALLRSLAAGLDGVAPGPARADSAVQPVELLRQLGMAWADIDGLGPAEHDGARDPDRRAALCPSEDKKDHDDRPGDAQELRGQRRRAGAISMPGAACWFR